MTRGRDSMPKQVMAGGCWSTAFHRVIVGGELERDVQPTRDLMKGGRVANHGVYTLCEMVAVSVRFHVLGKRSNLFSLWMPGTTIRFWDVKMKHERGSLHEFLV